MLPWLDDTEDTGLPKEGPADPFAPARPPSQISANQNVPGPDTPTQMDPKVKQYMLDKYFAAANKQGVNDAHDKQQTLNMAASIGDLANAAFNSPKGGISFVKGWNESGPPQSTTPLQQKGSLFDGVRQVGATGVANAEKARANNIQDFEMENKLGLQARQMGREDKQDSVQDEELVQKRKDRATKAEYDDPNSEISRRSGVLYQSTLLQKAKEAEMAGDSGTASQLREAANSAEGLSANQTYSLGKSLSGLDYKDALNAVRDQNKLKYQEDRADLRAAKDREGNAAKVKAENYKNTVTMREQYDKDLDTKQTKGIIQGAQTVFKAAENPSAAGDMSLIYGYMKVMDPGSTVREGEFASAQNSGSVDQRVSALYNQILKGQRLTPEQRADFVNQTKAKVQGQLDRQKDVDARYQSIAEKNGIPWDEIADPSFYKYGQSAKPTLAPEDAAAVEWAKANPKDPRAAQILKHNGM